MTLKIGLFNTIRNVTSVCFRERWPQLINHAIIKLCIRVGDDDIKNLNEMAGVRCATALISLRFLLSSSLTLIRVQFSRCITYLNEVHVFEFHEDLPPGLHPAVLKHGAEIDQDVLRRVFFPHLLELSVHPLELLLVLGSFHQS